MRAKLDKISETEFSLSGDLTFITTTLLYKQSCEQFNQKADQLIIDLKAVEHSDSAGLALIVEWYRVAKMNNQSLKVLNMPKQMSDLAELSSVNKLLKE